MENLNVTLNANQGFQNFALEFSNDRNVKSAVEFGTDNLDTVQDVDDYEKLIALFLNGKISVIVEKINEDCTFRKEIIKY